MLFSEAIVKFSAWQSFSKRKNTMKSYRVHLMHFALYMRNCLVSEVTLDHVMAYLQTMREIGWDQNSYMVKCIAFRKFFEFMGKLKETALEFELIPLIEREFKMPKVAKREDYYKVLNAIPQLTNDPRHIRNRLFLMMFKDTGMRLGENLSLDVDMKIQRHETKNEKGEIIGVLYSTIVGTEKSKKPTPVRQVFWTQETQDQLEKWLAKRKHLESVILGMDPKALYISVTGTKTGQRLNKGGGTEVMRRLSHLAGLSYVMNSHQLRHLFGHDLGEKKFPDSTVSIMMGHANPASSYIYRLMNGGEMATVAAELRAPVDK